MTPDDRELLIRLDERTAKIVKALEDNGQLGLISRVSVVETAVKSLTSNMRLLAWLLGIITAIAGVVIAAVKH